MKLESLIKQTIRSQGDIPIDHFMELALMHPEFGYYQSKNPFGRQGDFTTAPEISQLFGEMVGLWVAYQWQQLHCPESFYLIELGPGRGLMMQDILRATRHIESFHSSVRIALVETSSRLRSVQQENLQPYHSIPIEWYDNVSAVPDAASIIVANEFFDALPIKQYIKEKEGYKERFVGLDSHDQLCVVTGKHTANHPLFTHAPYPQLDSGSIVEISSASLDVIDALASRIATHRGAALVIDYGYTHHPDRSKTNETLQAIRSHHYCSVLEHIGQADITAHVNFSQLKEHAMRHSIHTTDIITQSAFLHLMGIEIRVEKLLQSAQTDQEKESLLLALHRLTDAAQMGELFKTFAIHDPSLKALW